MNDYGVNFSREWDYLERRICSSKIDGDRFYYPGSFHDYFHLYMNDPHEDRIHRLLNRFNREYQRASSDIYQSVSSVIETLNRMNEIERGLIMRAAHY